ncbi:hypothetical protein NHX12_025397, partial [Muraenolepis orangiensis]
VVHRCELKEAAGGGGRRVCSIDRRDKHNDSMTFMMDDKGSSRLLVLELEEPRFTAEVEEFTPDAEYTVRVRTVGLDKGLITIIILCVLAPVLVLLGSIPIMKLKKRRFIPTPVLHYPPLSNHYQGVIKNRRPRRERRRPGGRRQRQSAASQRRAARAGASRPPPGPYPRVRRDPGARREEALGGTGEGDSGCCLCSVGSLDDSADEEDHRRWYRNAYCTLSDTQCALLNDGQLLSVTG